MTLDYGNYGIFLIMGNAGVISSTVSLLPFEAPFFRRSDQREVRLAEESTK